MKSSLIDFGRLNLPINAKFHKKKFVAKVHAAVEP